MHASLRGTVAVVVAICGWGVRRFPRPPERSGRFAARSSTTRRNIRSQARRLL